MSDRNENVVYEKLSMEQWKAAVKDDPDLSVVVFTRGISMFPLLHASRDSVRLTPYRREMKIGDIIMFIRKDGQEIVHRLCWMDEELVQTIGDNCDRPDAKIPRSSVVGLVTHVNNRGHLIHVDTGFWRFYGRFMMWSNPVRMFIRDRMFRPVRKLAWKIVKGKK